MVFCYFHHGYTRFSIFRIQNNKPNSNSNLTNTKPNPNPKTNKSCRAHFSDSNGS